MGERPGKEIPKESRDVVNQLLDRDPGWRYEANKHGGGYPKLWPPKETALPPISLQKTPQDNQDAANKLRRKIRRCGGLI